MEQFNRLLQSSAVSLLTIAMAMSVAQAQERGNVLEEITVTAQKREQNLQDVGIAVTAFTGDQMRALGLEQSYDLADFTPGVHIGGNLGNQNLQYTIRGVTQNDFNDIIESPNAVYLDEGYMALANAQTFALFDIERVEILKGPQGTLFGRNATGGLVHYHSVKPSLDETQGFLDLTYGQFDSDADAGQLRVEGAIGGPFSDQAAGRIAFMYNDQDGYLQNDYPAAGTTAFTGGSPGPGAGADMGGEESFAIRGSLLFEPSDKLSIALSVNVADADVDTGPYQTKSTIGVYNSTPTIAGPTFPDPASIVGGAGELINVIDTPAGETRFSIVQGTNLDGGCDPADVGLNSLTCFGTAPAGRPIAGADFFGYLDPDGAGFTTSGDFAFEDQGMVEASGFNAKIVYDFSNGIQLTSVSDYKEYEKLLFIDVDSGPANTTANYAGADASSLTQELRLSGEGERTRWVAGLYYLNIDTDSDNGLKVPPGSVLNPNVSSVLFAVPTSPTLGGDLATEAQLETDSFSAFGQIEFDFSDQLRLIAGARVVREEKDYNLSIGVYPTTDSRTIHQGDFTSVFTPVPTTLGALGVPIPGAGTFTPPGGPAFLFSSDTSDTLITGKLQLDWTVSDDLLVYAGVNRGVKAGSFNAPLIGSWVGATLATGGSSFIPYDEEVLMAYEGGFKATVFDGSTRINGSIYYYDYTDYQAFLFTGIGGNVINADAENVGFELDIQTSPVDGLDAMLAFAWFDATVKDVPLRIGSSIIRDVDPTYAPELQVSGLLRYEWPAFNGTLAWQGDFNYSDEFFYNLRNFDADKFDSYVLVNTRLTWYSQDTNWEASLSIRNVTDEEAGILGFDLAGACGCNEVSYQPPRWYGLSLRYNF